MGSLGVRFCLRLTYVFLCNFYIKYKINIDLIIMGRETDGSEGASQPAKPFNVDLLSTTFKICNPVIKYNQLMRLSIVTTIPSVIVVFVYIFILCFVLCIVSLVLSLNASKERKKKIE